MLQFTDICEQMKKQNQTNMIRQFYLILYNSGGYHSQFKFNDFNIRLLITWKFVFSYLFYIKHSDYIFIVLVTYSGIAVGQTVSFTLSMSQTYISLNVWERTRDFITNKATENLFVKQLLSHMSKSIYV